MGYRSTVILGIPPKQKEEFQKIIRKHNIENRYKLVKEDKDMLIYEGEYLKWYSEFNDVKDVEELLRKAQEKNENSSFLVGIGEDGAIHSEMGDWYDYVGISTTHEIY